MASVGELLAALRAVLAGFDAARASVVEAVLRADEAAGIVANATAGTSRVEVQAIAVEYRQGAGTVRAAAQVVERIAGDVARYVASLESGGPISASRATGAAVTPVRREEHGEDTRVVAARERLPPPVTRGRGQKTRGEWFTGSGGGGGEVSSGRDGLSERADELLRESGTPLSPLAAAAHAELKFAAHMRDAGIREATLVVNHVPCEGAFGCEVLLPVLLPQGYVLTVHGANGFKRVFRGGGEPKW